MSIGFKRSCHCIAVAALLFSGIFEVAVATSPAAEASLKSPLDYLPEHCLAAFVAKPARLVQETELEILGNVPLLGQLPIPATEFESIVGFAALGPATGDPVAGLILRFRREYFRPTILKWLASETNPVADVAVPTFEGEGSLKICALADARTVILCADVGMLNDMLTVERQAPATKKLRELSERSDFTAVVDYGRIRDFVDHPYSWNDESPALQWILSLPRDLGMVAVDFRFGKRNSDAKIAFARRRDVQTSGRFDAWVPTASRDVERLLELVGDQWNQTLWPAEREKSDAVIATVVAAVAALRPTNDGAEATLSAPAAPLTRLFKRVGELMLPMVMSARNVARSNVNRNNFKQLHVAWFSHENQRGVLPTDITSKDGKPLLSWRVRILPYLDQEALYKEFHLDEPWDSEHNKRLLEKMPPMFENTFSKQPGLTHLQSVTGKGCVLPGPTRFQDHIDAKSTTVWFIEAKRPIPWTKPEDVPYAPTGMHASLFTDMAGRTVLGMADGSVNSYSKLADETYAKLFLIGDRNPTWLGELEPERAGASPSIASPAEFEAAIIAAKAEANVTTLHQLAAAVPIWPAKPPEHLRDDCFRLISAGMRSDDALIRNWCASAALRMIPEMPDAESLIEVLARAAPEARWLFLNKLSQHPDERSARMMVAAVQSEHDRSIVAQLLASRFAEDKLTKLLQDSDPEVVQLVCEALETAGTTSVATALAGVPTTSQAHAAARRALSAIEARTKAAEAEQVRAEQVAERRQTVAQANAALKQGDAKAAATAMDKIVELDALIWGKASDNVLEVIEQFSEMHMKSGDSIRALTLLEQKRDLLTERFGKAYWRTRDAIASLDLYRKHLALTPAETKARDRGQTASALASKESKANNLDAAAAAMREAAAEFESVYGPQGIITNNAYRSLRAILARQDKHPEAAAVARRVVAADVAVVGDDHPATLKDAAESTFLTFLAGDSARGLEEMRALAPKLEAAGNFANAAIMYKTLGEHSPEGLKADARRYFHEAIRVSDLTGDSDMAADICRHLGNVASAGGDLAAAEAWHFDSQWRYARKDPVAAAYLNLPSLADVYEAAGRPHLELTVRQLAVQTMSQSESKQIGAYVVLLKNLARTQLDLGDFAVAEQTLRQADEIMAQLSPQPFQLYLELLFAKVKSHFGDEAGAKQSLDKALAIAEKQRPQSLPEVCTALAEHHLEQGEMSEALRHSEQAVELLAKSESESILDAIQLHIAILARAGKTEAAEAEFAEFQTLFRKRKAAVGRWETWIEQARLVLQFGEANEARELCRQGLAIARKHGAEGAIYAEALAAATPLLFRAGDVDGAAVASRDALRLSREIVERSAYILSPRQQIALSQTMRRSLDFSISMALENKGDAKDLFAEIYLWKGNTLIRQRELQRLRQQEDVVSFYDQLGTITNRLSAASRGAPAAAAGQQADAAAQAAAVDQLAGIQELLETQLSAARLAYLDLQPASTAADFAAALEPDQVFVDLFVFNCYEGDRTAEPHLLATLIRRSGVTHTLDLGPLAPLREAIAAWRTTTGESAAARQAGLRLRSVVWDPLSVGIRPTDLVSISPDGPLGGLPIFALPTDDGKYLIENYRIALIPVPQMLPAIMATRRSDDAASMLAVGDVDYDARRDKAPIQPEVASVAGADRLRGVRGSESFTPLPGTVAEIDFLEAFHKRLGLGIQVLRRDAASEAKFRERATQCRILHMATHGFFAEADAGSAESPAHADPTASHGNSRTTRVFDAGLLSGLALAGANGKPDAGGDDGVLTASEIAVLDLNGVDLAVLSACETGLGKESDGEGLLGIQRAFQVAGVRSTVASFWKVDDHATQVLMERFYENCRSKKLGKLDALREAQIWMLNHPDEVWAAPTSAAARGDRRLTPNAPKPTDGRLSPRYWAAFALSGHVGPIDVKKAE